MMLGMPVYKLMEEMPYQELVNWFKYLKVRPYGWRDDYRAFSIMSSVNMSGSKAKPEDVFESLRAIFKDQEKRKIKLARGAVPSGLMLERMLTAKGGDGHSLSEILNKGGNE